MSARVVDKADFLRGIKDRQFRLDQYAWNSPLSNDQAEVWRVLSCMNEDLQTLADAMRGKVLWENIPDDE